MTYKKIERCRICGNHQLERVLDLGEQMLTGVFPREKGANITRGPLHLVKCTGDGAIPAILRRLHRPYSALVVNAEVRSVDLRRLLQPSRLAITADRIYQPEEMGVLF